jgi:hypothetical protein
MNISQHISSLIFTAIIRWFDNTEVKRCTDYRVVWQAKSKYKITPIQ